jgi:hypothetical protein
MSPLPKETDRIGHGCEQADLDADLQEKVNLKECHC